MRSFTRFALLLVGLWLAMASLSASAQSPARSAKPSTTRPWTYWWWMGSAVSEADISRQLDQFAKAGLGGVHIIPIYGVRGYEAQSIPFLSPRWLSVFAHTVREAHRRGLGVDLTTGTGWPFGGPNVTPDMAARQWQLQAGQLVSKPTRQQVKRAAPGGEGPVIDPFSQSAMQQYLRRFDSTLATLPTQPRAVYNDSYEAYGANWTTDFPAEFRQRRGYDLSSQLAAFLDSTSTDGLRVRQDYQQTLAELLRDASAGTWTRWAAQRGYQTRYQAHGSPGNLIDLYALASIPETESFGSSRFPIPGLRVDENYEIDRFGTPHPLAMKFASSAANLTGKPLVSSETGTWLADHFKVSLSQIKPQVDELFTAGINHIFYHGITYSPAGQNGSNPSWPDQSWPGWLFYASTNYGPSSHFWPQLPLLNQYIDRCQSRLQTSHPDNDLLVYFPMHDLWATRARSAGGLHMLEVHHVDRWLLPLPFGQLCDSLRLRGYAFDYVSDQLLSTLKTDRQGRIMAGNASYRAVVIPRCTYLPETTMAQLNRLARQGVRVIFEGGLPEQVPGFYQHQARSQTLRQLGAGLRRLPVVSVSRDVVATLGTIGIRREAWASRGLLFIRKRQGDSVQYFITNLGNQFRAGWITLAASGGPVIRYDPLTNQQSTLPDRRLQSTRSVWLRLEPGQSCFLTVSPAAPRPDRSPPVASVGPGQPMALPIGGPWQLTFMTGQPALNLSRQVPELTSWTTLADSAGYFWGTVRYETTFDLSASIDPAAVYELDLGSVREVAAVRLNGKPLGTAWCLPFRLTIPAGQLKPGRNRLDIDVTNLSANYMRLYDRQQPGWKKFHDINIVDIRYRPFDASRWPAEPSGLLGPVRIVSYQ
ncbi:glycosyl hydrolase [Spirosoma sordidisoli]|nr:glycosyl hydrolase [Spirosoma sordidisoli]